VLSALAAETNVAFSDADDRDRQTDRQRGNDDNFMLHLEASFD